MNITLPDSMRIWIETQAQLEGHLSADSYVEEMLREKKERLNREIDQQLIEGIESGAAVEINDEFWVERRRVLRQKDA